MNLLDYSFELWHKLLRTLRRFGERAQLSKELGEWGEYDLCR